MIIEFIGFLTLLAGFLILYKGPDWGVYILMLATLLGAAAAVKLPALGGANIMPAHALLLFYILAAARSYVGVGPMFSSLAFPKAGFWLAAFTLYGVITALFLPRVFAGSTDVFSLARVATERSGIVVAPLAPQTSNITQTVYLLGNLALFSAIYAHVNRGGKRYVVGALLFAACANLVFAFFDIATFSTETTELLSFIRNANYGILAENSINGFKRIVGSFTEASAFGGVTTFFFVFCFELWLRGRHSWVTGWLSLISLAALVLSTSSSAYLGLGVYSVSLWLRCGFNLLYGVASPKNTFIVFGLPILAFLLVSGLILIPSLWTAIIDLVDATFINKLDSRSGIERTAWNAQALKAFFDTYMFGAGVGSVRASSLFVALLANVGLLGTLLFILFILTLLNSARTKAQDAVDPVVGAALWACFIALPPALVAGTSVDLGLIFFALAALATAVRSIERKRFTTGVYWSRPVNRECSDLAKINLKLGRTSIYATE